jgi:iron complex transport system ATP-binding protein
LELVDASVDLAGRRVLENINLTVARGEVLGILGANGSGKSTLLRAALGLARLIAGQARLGGRDVGALSDAGRAELVGYLPQERRVGWNLPAWRVAALGAARRPPAEARQAALEALDRVGAGPLAERGVLDMSGGERARVLLARLVATGAPLLVADEPAAGLDPDAQFMVMELLAERAKAGTTIVVTLHDLTLAARACDRVAILAGGRMVAAGEPRTALTREVLKAAFALDGEIAVSSAGAIAAVRRSQ